MELVDRRLLLLPNFYANKLSQAPSHTNLVVQNRAGRWRALNAPTWHFARVCKNFEKTSDT